MKTLSVLLALSERSTNAELWYFLYCLLLSKQASCQWFKTSWYSYDVTVILRSDKLQTQRIMAIPSYNWYLRYCPVVRGDICSHVSFTVTTPGEQRRYYHPKTEVKRKCSFENVFNPYVILLHNIFIYALYTYGVQALDGAFLTRHTDPHTDGLVQGCHS